MDRDALERARSRVASAGTGAPDPGALDASLERARGALEELAERTAELEAAVPERLGAAVQESMRVEVLPVARHVAEVRGLSAQVIRRLERLQVDFDGERRARVGDLALLVDLVASGWRGVERRLDRMERIVDRLERALDQRPVAEVYRIEERGRGPRA
ncbi:MAG: hypothetical protein M3312_06635 [Actinomycetota bacterium]|nr:hypothetical protein [Actinomycetota bacterium]